MISYYTYNSITYTVNNVLSEFCIDNYSCSTVFILEIYSYTRRKYGKKLAIRSLRRVISWLSQFRLSFQVNLITKLPHFD
jgi:hypothetical protein